VIKIEDISAFVAEQRQYLRDFDQLMVPAETIYQPRREDAVENMMLDSPEPKPVS